MAYGYWICEEYPQHRLYFPKDVVSETMGDAIKERTRERLKGYVNEKYGSDDAYAVLLTRAYDIDENIAEFDELYTDIMEQVEEDISCMAGEDFTLFGLHYVWHSEDGSYDKKSQFKPLIKLSKGLFRKKRR